MRFISGIVALLFLSGPLMADGANWKYFSQYTAMFNVIPEAIASNNGPNGIKVCAMEGWTAENSGFPEAAANWNTSFFPNGVVGSVGDVVEADVLRSAFAMIDSAGTGQCDMIALPWFFPVLQPNMDRLAADNGFVELAGLSAPQVASPAPILGPQAAGNSAALMDAADATAKGVLAECDGGMTDIEFDCGCISDSIKAQIVDGRIPPQSDPGTLWFFYRQGGDTSCIDDAALRQDIIKFCENQNFYSGGTRTMDCDCAADFGVSGFYEHPVAGRHLDFFGTAPFFDACPLK